MRGASHGAERVAIVDFDNHRGNGAQQIFWSDLSVLYASTHETRIIRAPAHGGSMRQSVNAPLPENAGSKLFRDAMETKILPRATPSLRI